MVQPEGKLRGDKFPSLPFPLEVGPIIQLEGLGRAL